MKLQLSLVAGALACTLPAQSPCTRSLDIDAATGIALNLGVQYLGGNLYVSGTASTTAGPWEIFVIDPSDGSLLGRFPQPGVTSGFGLRDGATDGASLFFGNENGVVGFDIAGNPVTTIVTANDPAAPFAPITGAALAANGNLRALAYNPMGNGGDGSFFSGDFGDDIIEFDLAGNILNTLPNNATWSAYGLAYDGSTDTLWVNDGRDGVTLLELDAATGTPTGNTLASVSGSPGGLSFGTTTQELVALTQATPDTVEFLYRDGPVRFLTRVDSSPLDASNKSANVLAQEIELRMDGRSRPGSTPVLTFFNFEPDSGQCGFIVDPSLAAAMPNFTVLAPYTMPQGNALALVFPQDSSVVFPAEDLVGVVPDGRMRAQGVYLDVNLAGTGVPPLRATNDVLIELDSTPIVGILTSADGPNSFNSDTSGGYWKVENSSTNPDKAIASITFDFAVNLPALVFDTDQIGMADAFWNGNSTVTGSCSGTYRNGSDVVTGLDYAAPEINLANPSCQAGPGENSGAEASNQSSGNSYNTLTWRFAGGQFYNGAAFEFDIDTDGGGTNGAANAGMVVTVTLVDGSVLSGELVATGAERAEVLL